MRTTIIKKIIPLLTLFVSTHLFAVAAGGYVYFDIGAGKTKNSTKTQSNTNSGIAGGLGYGYQFNPYSAFEFGYMHWANGQAFNSCGSSVLVNNSIDLLGKGILAISAFHVFAEGGLGLLRTSGAKKCIKTTTNLKPLIGVGVGYDLSQTTVAELSYKQLLGHTYTPSAITLTLSYHFVDVYCGQFLA